MALNVYELARSRPLSRTVDAASVVLQFIAFYSADELAVNAAVLSVAPTSFDGYLRVRASQQPQGAGVWLCEVEYAFSQLNLDATAAPAPGETDPLGSEYTGIDITAGQVHITQSIRTTHRWQAADQLAAGSIGLAPLEVSGGSSLDVIESGATAGPGDVGKKVVIGNQPGWTPGVYTIVAAPAGNKWTLDRSPGPAGTKGGSWVFLADDAAIGTAANYKQAIGVRDGRVEGADIYAPAEEFGLVSQVGPFYLSHKRLIRALAATVNSAPWRGFAAGELLYLGCSARPGPNNAWALNHKFAAGQNLYAVPVSDTLVVPSKQAWEYLWVTYRDGVDGTAVTKTPDRAYTEQVYKFSDFTAGFALLNLAG